jgi:hypothetical protein
MVGKLEGRDYSKEVVVDGRISKLVWEGVEWTHVAQDRDQWWALVKAVMNL